VIFLQINKSLVRQRVNDLGEFYAARKKPEATVVKEPLCLHQTGENVAYRASSNAISAAVENQNSAVMDGN